MATSAVGPESEASKSNSGCCSRRWTRAWQRSPDGPQLRYRHASRCPPSRAFQGYSSGPQRRGTTLASLGAREFFPAGDQFEVAGFGNQQKDEGSLGRLLVARLTTVSHRSDLQIRLIDPVTRGKSPGMSACSGDSGGPVFERTAKGLVLVAVVSWAAATNGAPGCGGLTGATPIAPIRTWIIEAIERLNSSPS
jgi:Trypsin